MEAYTSFASIYDLFMDNIPYETWCEYLTGLLQEYGVSDGLVLELGCGTGTMTRLLSDRGYDMIGVDLSEEMLDMAMARQQDGRILYLLQDMREFELYGTVRAVVSICDSLNYILEYKDLVKVFTLVNNYLDPGGVFIFDLNTCYKYEQILGDQVIAENREEGSFIWENYYDEEEAINEFDLTLFIKEADGRYCKYEETHYQRAFSLETVKQALNETGMTFVTAYDAFTKNAPHETSERVYLIAQECQKHEKE
ncbi:MAG: class I SAM-dependent DNA methyltransferase [Lachnospiraceae bacterium]